ncbi:MAG: hypothetical protein IKJ58_08045 [Akkermansia sp.]|nr:hypothetical protein [Akkermansia sp.]
MKLRNFTLSALLSLSLLQTLTANELPPSDVTPYELLSPREHAELYLNLLTIIYSELIPLQDSVQDAESAAAAAQTIEALHSRLNLAINHIANNPDTINEVQRILRNAPERSRRFHELQEQYAASYISCRSTGLITSREFCRTKYFPVFLSPDSSAE